MSDHIRVGEVKLGADLRSATVEVYSMNPVLADQLEDLRSKQAAELARHAAIRAGLPATVGCGGFAVLPHGVTVDGEIAGTVERDGSLLPFDHPKNTVHHYRATIKIR